MKRQLTKNDILPYAEYEKVRDEKRRAIIAMKKNRRVAVGPYATFYFESYDTMWLQVHEMLRIEKGGDEQIADELRAYNPMIPNGRELTATVMFEIDDAARRAAVLSQLGGVENNFEIRLGSEIIAGTAEQDLDYTSAEGKASSVQFVHFAFSPQQIMFFRDPATQIIVAVNHPRYAHMAALLPETRRELSRDFSAA